MLFLAVLRFWSGLRRDYWCAPPPRSDQAFTIWPWARSDAWTENALDRLIDVLERLAPSCRVVVCDSSGASQSAMRWPELARFMAVVGPQDALLGARKKLEPALKRLARRSGEMLQLESHPEREILAKIAFMAWATLQKADTRDA